MIDTALKQYFGFSEFRPLQREIVEAAMAGSDVFALMPTGAGKSLCFQLPAAMLPGITVVISPLIALMKDQVDALNATGIPATFLNSSLEGREQSARIQGLRDGKYKLLYVAPERFPTTGFLDFLSSLNVSLCVVDEAHCISEWGHDFRVDYRNLRILRERFPSAPIMAVTATATDRVANDIISQLHLRDPKLFRASFDRKNLIYQVWPKRATTAQLIGYLEKRKGESGIIYCLSREGTQRLAETLQVEGHRAMAYHAGLERSDRSRVQDKFDRDEIDIVCATIAFGMGIDKPNARYVIHHDLPKSIPAYYQETGRAGRDSLNSDCILFLGTNDRSKYLKFFDEKPPEEKERAIQELNTLVDMLESRTCRRKELLAYFGETYPAENCAACDNCLTSQPVEQFDGTRVAQMFLSCVERLRRQNQSFGIAHIVDILRGSERERILQWDHQKLKTFGVGKDYSRDEWKHFANDMRKQGLIIQDHSRLGIVKMTAAGQDVLLHGKTVTLTRPKDTESFSKEAVDLPTANKALFEDLKKLRRDIAYASNVPPYIVFNDATLKEIAGRVPLSGEEFRAISGVGETKARQYGVQFLSLVRRFRDVHADLERMHKVQHVRREAKTNDSTQDTLAFFRKGYDPKRIAETRGLAISTINGHLASLVQTGAITSLDRLVASHKLQPIRDAFRALGLASLSQVREHLGEDYSYDDLRFVRSFDEKNAK